MGLETRINRSATWITHYGGAPHSNAKPSDAALVTITQPHRFNFHVSDLIGGGG
jgi:hypothetical protein